MHVALYTIACRHLPHFYHKSGHHQSHSAVVANWMPEIHEYYADHMERLHKHDLTLERNFPSSIFTTTTYNLGPR